MSITTGAGRRIVTGERRSRMKKKHEVEERSRQLYEMKCQGYSIDEVRRIFRISERHAFRLVAAIPESVKRQIKRKVAAERRALLEDVAERLEAS